MNEQTSVADEYLLRSVRVDNSGLEAVFLVAGACFFFVVTYAVLHVLVKDFLASRREP